MKKFYLLLVLVSGSYILNAQTLITYGKQVITVDEFLRAYNKNKTNSEEKEIREYINLYTNFKLKVQAAKELRLDTLQQIKTDIENFRRQVEENYMTDEKGKELLIAEAVDRSYRDLQIAHFLVPVAAGADAADTIKSYNSVKATYDELKKGTTDYSGISKRLSSNSILM